MSDEINLITAVKKSIRITEGDAHPLTITLTEKDTNTPIDLTGEAVYIEIRTKKENETPTYIFSTLNGKISVTGAGHNVISIPSWGSIAAGDYSYKLFTLKADATKTTWFFGGLYCVK